MKRASMAFAGVLFGAGLQGIGLAQAPTTSTPQRTAYLFSVKCFVANNAAASDRRYAKDAGAVAKYRGQAQRSQQYAYQVGRALGTSDADIREDIESYSVMLTGVFKRDTTAFAQLRADCTKIGLM